MWDRDMRREEKGCLRARDGDRQADREIGRQREGTRQSCDRGSGSA